MRVVVQRCTQARVEVNKEVIGTIDKGLLILLGIGHEDTLKDIEWMTKKIVGLRIFEDETGKMNRSVLDEGGGVLVVSQFTLYGNCRKGRRPSFVSAANPDKAAPMVEQFCSEIELLGIPNVQQGRFGADMKVTLINDGPVTLIIDSPQSK